MKILNKLTLKHLVMNKKRTIVTIIGVILSTALMVGVGLIVSSFRESLIEETIYYEGKYHASISNVSNLESKLIENNIHIKEYQKYNVDSTIYNGYEVEILGTDFSNLGEMKYEGILPSDNEIIVSKQLANFLELNIGDILKTDKEYKVVGLYDDESVLNIYTNQIFTKNFLTDNNRYDVLFDNVGFTYDYVNDIESLVDCEIETNDMLLEYYGVSKYNNINDMLTKTIIITLSLVSIACIIVIYNSFSISVSERKKQFGLFSSIGATKKQLMKSIYFEAFIIGLIGIPLGVLGSYIGIGLVLTIVNKLLNMGLIVSLKLATYPLFLIIPIIFMFIVIILSAYLPAKRASKISPIEAIRLNDDIKINKRKIKTSSLIKKLFGIEGEIALKNIKRNKKKYRITVVSLFISIVLFISFSSFIDYAFGGINDMLNVPNFDIDITSNDDLKLTEYLSKRDDVEDFIVADSYEFLYNNEINYIIKLDDNTYNKYLKLINKNDEKPILYNKYKTTDYEIGSRTTRFENKLDSIKNIEMFDYEILEGEYVPLEIFNTLSDYYITDEVLTMLDYINMPNLTFFVNQKIFDELKFERKKETGEILIKSNDYTKLDKDLKEKLDISDSNCNINVCYYNVTEEFKLEKNLITVVKIFVYGFIGLITLIGITSVINTINTSISLRRKEFAVLRSVGLSKKGFNKMLFFESIFFGLKSLLFALPVSLLIVVLIHYSVNDVIRYNSIMIPYKAIIYSIIGVFIVIFICMLYSSSKIKNENILEAIREENI